MSVRVLLAAQAHALLYRTSRRVASRVCSHSDAACPVKSTQKWIRDVVVGLNLCPWAGAPLQHGDLRIVESTTTDALECARREFDRCGDAPPDGHHRWPCAFEDYLDLVDAVDDAIDAAGHRGAIQLATFHPEYQFGDAAPDAASHWTNRSPFPVLHLLREADVERALESKDGHDVWKRNVAAVEALGAVDMERRVRDCLT